MTAIRTLASLTRLLGAGQDSKAMQTTRGSEAEGDRTRGHRGDVYTFARRGTHTSPRFTSGLVLATRMPPPPR